MGQFSRTVRTGRGAGRDLAAFVGCHAADDTANKTVRQYEAALSALDPQREQIYTTLELLLRDASPADLAAAIAGDARLAANRFFLEQRRKNAALRLPKEQELLAADLAVDAIHAWGSCTTDFRRIANHGDGEGRVGPEVGGTGPLRPPRTECEAEQLLRGGQGVEDAGRQLRRRPQPHRRVPPHRLQAVGLRDHLEVPLQRNRMTRETLDAMWSTITARKPMLLRYLDAKAKRMGLEKLAWYDVYAPLPESGAPAAEIPWSEACDSILRTFSAFSPDFGDFARHAFSSRWVEAENRSGKRQGAFCTGIPSRKQTRVFMTYLGSDDQISTLAHELGTPTIHGCYGTNRCSCRTTR